ncbi:MAG: FUSC family protein [Culicoidibacterales bacterium]
MNNKLIPLIFSKTLMFIIIIIFVNVFGALFGPTNTLLGVTTLTLALTLMGQNLLVNFWRNFALMLGINFVIGIAAFIAPMNIWLGLIVNFVIIFAIGYFFSFTIRRSLTLLVGLHYLFLLNTPITTDDIPLRILALIAGPVIIMVIQLVINHRKLEKMTAPTFTFFQNEIIRQLQQQTGSFDFTTLQTKIATLKVTVHDALPSGHSLNDYQSTVLTITSNFEYLAELLMSQQHALTPKLTDWLESELTTLLTDTHSLTTNELATIEVTPLSQQLTALLSNLRTEIAIWQTADPQQKSETLPKEFRADVVTKRNLHIHNINLRFALRLAILISGAFFLTEFFAFEYGRWLTFTLFSLTQPYSEATVERSKKRITGTLIGAIIGFIALTLIQNPDQRLLVILLFGYLSSYVTDYRNTMIFVTVTAVSSVALYSADPAAGFIIRIMWIGIGMCIALLANQVLLKTSYRDEARDLADLQTNIEQYQFYQLFASSTGQVNAGYFYSLAPTIASRLASSQQDELTPRYQLHARRILYIHQLFIASQSHPEIFQHLKNITTSDQLPEDKYKQLQDLCATASTAATYHFASVASQLYATGNTTR